MKSAPLALVAASLALALPVAAKPTFTPPVSVGTGAAVHCVVQNIGTKARTVAVEVRDATGMVLAAVPEVIVQPGTFQAPAGVLAPSTGAACVFDGLSRTMRGYIRVTADGTTQTVIPAAR
jgi:hypothetical protein